MRTGRLDLQIEIYRDTKASLVVWDVCVRVPVRDSRARVSWRQSQTSPALIFVSACISTGQVVHSDGQEDVEQDV